MIDVKAKKELTKLLLVISSILFGIYCFVLAPLYTYVSTNVILYMSVLPQILALLLDAVDILSYAVCFSIIIYSVFLLSLKKSTAVICSYICLLFMKYSSNFVMSMIVSGDAFNFDDMTLAILPFFFDVIILAIILAVSHRQIAKYNERKALRACEEVYPFKALLSLQNPLLSSAFVFALIMSVVKILPRIRYDILLGAPTSLSEVLWMCIYYLGDVLSGVIIYTVAIFVFTKLCKKYGTNL